MDEQRAHSGLRGTVMSRICYKWVHPTKIVKEPLRHFRIPKVDLPVFIFATSCNTFNLQISSDGQKETLLVIIIV